VKAGARFADSLLKAIKGEKNIVEAAYVQSDVATKDGIDFFSTNVELGVCLISFVNHTI
jgi:malate dehydrogenase